MTRWLFGTLIVWATLASATAEAQNNRRSITLRVGEQEIISAEGVENYSDGVPGIVDIRVPASGQQIVIVALRPGTTTLLLIYTNGRQVQIRINVVPAEDEPDDVEAKDNIRLDLYFIQLQEAYNHQIGIGWPGTIGGQGVFEFTGTIDVIDTSFVNATALITSQPLPRLDLLQSSGWARLQRQAALVTSNGTQAQFFSGEEINIQTVSNIGAGALQVVEFGARTRMTPRYDQESGRIELDVFAEMSDLTSGRGTGVPGRTLAQVDTTVNLELGQAVILGGLTGESSSRDATGLPGLSQIPIIGVLFGTHQERREFTQNVIFIVPTVVDVVGQQARQRIVDALELYWDYSGGLSDIELMPRPEGVPSAAHPDAIRERARRERRRRTRPEE